MVHRHILGIVAALAACCPAFAQQTPADSDLVQIEETWVMRVDMPDPDSAGPQVVCLMSPFGSEEQLFCLLEINHRSMWSFRPGGIQLQMWEGSFLHKVCELDRMEVLSKPQEVIRWTMRATLKDGQLTVEVVDGESSTWGVFGNDTLKISMPTKLANLNSYSIKQSVVSSGVVYGGNRVSELKVLEVRRTTKGGVVSSDRNAHVLHPAE